MDLVGLSPSLKPCPTSTGTLAEAAAVYFASPVICSFVLFTVFWAQGQQLALSDVYFALALLYVLRSSVGMMWTRSVEPGVGALA